MQFQFFPPSRQKNLPPFLLLAAGLILLLFVLTPHLLQQKLQSQMIQEWVARFGWGAPLVYILLNVATVVIPPLIITPFWLAGILLFPPFSAFLYIYSANLIGHSLNFYLARRWGRPLIIKLTGKRGLKQIDRFTGIRDWRTVLILRFLGSGASDYISYALGLTQLPFLLFFLITAFSSLFWTSISFYLLFYSLQQNLALLLHTISFLVLLSYFLMFVLTTFFLQRWRKKQEKV